MVDGKAAAALAELARVRWTHGACERAPPVRPTGDPWPQQRHARPDRHRRRHRAHQPRARRRERDPRSRSAVLRHGRSRRALHLYREPVSHLETLRRAPCAADDRRGRELEAVLVTPKHAHSWLEEQTMQAGLGRFMQVFADKGVSERVRFLYPKVAENGRSIDTMVHSKVMVVDDRMLRVGSANLNNRSFGVDTECDLAFEAASARAPQANSRRARPPGRPFLRRERGARSRPPPRRAARSSRRWSRFRSNGHSLAPIELDHAAPGRSPRSRNSAIPSARSRRRNSPNPSSASGRRRGGCAASRRSLRSGCLWCC